MRPKLSVLAKNRLSHLSLNSKFGFSFKVEKTIDQVQEAGSSALDTAQQILDIVGKALKPAIGAGVPIAQKAEEEALKAASPAYLRPQRKPKKQFKVLPLIPSQFSVLLRFAPISSFTCI
ncbi:hypothetical protein DITRI_Ditri04bG0033500 [Diplodiscus trichospermus]